jgi:hypothetical protein
VIIDQILPDGFRIDPDRKGKVEAGVAHAKKTPNLREGVLTPDVYDPSLNH